MSNLFEKYNCFGIDISTVVRKLDFHSSRKSVKREDAGSVIDLKDPALINADPFLFVHGDRLYLFYEQMTFMSPIGKIMMTSTKDLKHWTMPKQISCENDIHFSFPYVFEDDGQVYMMPETGWCGEIRLYKATSPDLTKFDLDTVIMKREVKDENVIFDFADNIIYKKDGIYYLFTSILDEMGYQLLLYTSNDLRGPYKQHPFSPICHNHEFGRNAGSIIENNGKMYRPTQDCSQTYGGQVNIMEIKKLTPYEYEESLYAEHILPTNERFYRQGGHQLNYAEFKDVIVMATDAKRDRTFVAKRIFEKLKRIVLNLKKI